MSDVNSNYVPGDYRTLIKVKHYIDLPGESPKSKLWCGVNNLIILRKHRDVVFDIKLGNGATYTVTTDKPENEYSRFYDPKRKLNTTKVTFQDGEPCHIWLGRTFQGSLVLKQGDKVMGRYPIRKMDCTERCTEDPKDKPAPLLIILHENKALDDTLHMLGSPQRGALRPAPPVGIDTQVAAAPIPFSEVRAIEPAGGLPTIHAFKVTQTHGPHIPEELAEWFKSGTTVYDWDPTGTLSRNFIVAMITGSAGAGYTWDTFWKGPLREFWKRKFLMYRNSAGEFTLLFSTSAKERKLLGFLLTTYVARPNDVRVLTLAAGTGSLTAPFRSAWEGVKGGVNVKTLTGKMFYFALAMDSGAWMHDYFFEPVGSPKHRDVADLLATLISDGLQAAVATIFATLAYALTLAFVASGVTISVPATVIGLGLVAVTWVFGIGAAMAFNHWDVTYKIAVDIRSYYEAMEKLNNRVSELIRGAGRVLEEQLPRDYGDAYSQSKWKIFPVGTAP